jgi:hypothetical protein
MRRVLVRIAIVSAFVVLAHGLAAQTQIPTGPPPDARFQSNVAEYMAQRATVAAALPALPARATWLQIASTMAALADGIATARRESGARIFTDDLHWFFRDLTELTLVEYDIDVKHLLASQTEDNPPRAPKPRVNERFHWGLGAAMPPCILEAYPRLPTVLQYRFVGRDLLIIDIEAGLVVDILSKAIPKP